MTTRLTILPDPRFAELQAGLSERLQLVGASVQADNFASLLDGMMRDVLAEGFEDVAADEGTVWLVDHAGEYLVPAYNNGPQAEQFVAKFRQPLKAGLVCMVFANEQPFLENEVTRNARQSKLLDELLGVQTEALMVVPFYLLQRCRGVVSCVRLSRRGQPGPTQAKFRPADLGSLQRTATLLSRLLEYRLLGETVGWPAMRSD